MRCIRIAVASLALAGQAVAQGAHPDLTGVWSNLTTTPLERPPQLTGATATEAEAAAFERASPEAFLADTSDGVGGRQSEGWEVGGHMLRIAGEIRTSILTKPADGKLPYSAEGRKTLQASLATRLQGMDGPEQRPAPDRCLTGVAGGSGTPVFVPRYNNQYRLVQTREAILLHQEQGSEVRIIRMGAAPEVAPPRRWMGNSVGRWEGDTLVVETQGFMPGDAFKSPLPIHISAEARVTEWFSRVSPTGLLYRFRVEDPAMFSEPWEGEAVWTATDNRLFEYACHEGNASLAHILRGARVEDERASRAARR